MLVWRDFKIRYSQTAIGVLWGFVQPILTVGILTLVFGKFIKVEYRWGAACCFYSKWPLAPGRIFSFVISNSGNSIIGAQQLI